VNYSPYLLSDNPFPQSAVVDVFSSDRRINGSIFFEGIFIKELTLLRQRIDTRTNMVYVAGLQFDRGVGKSAILAYVWRQMRQDGKLFTAFIRCTETPPTNKPPGFCNAVVAQLHQLGYVWTAFWRLMLRYAEERRSLIFTKESVEMLSSVFPAPVDSLPLTLYTHVPDVKRFSREVAKWLETEFNIGEHFAGALADSYLSKPNTLTEKLAGKTADPVRSLGDAMTLLEASGFEYGYIFLDQFEDSVMSTPTGRMGEFALGLRRMLEVSSGRATIVVTLHPDSEQKLNSNPAVQNLQSLAPIDAKRYISLNVLDPRSELVVCLAREYLRSYRTEGATAAPSETFPVDPAVIRYVCFLKKGNLRYILQQLHECINQGAIHGGRLIDMEFVLQNHEATMGIELIEEKHDEFTKMMAASELRSGPGKGSKEGG
jgi:hypothetical protein